jgi:hypothetical protein
MVLRVWKAFLALFDRGEPGEESDEEGGEGRFVPSPLDRSVRIGHGGSDDEQLRALSEPRERARELEADRPDD